MRFTLKQIAYFVATAETGSITLASDQVNISQPSISSAITALEEIFGIQLFIRHHAQGLSLTSDGQRFLREAKALLLQAEEVENAANVISTRIAGPLEIGCISTLFPLMIPEILTVFQQRHAAARVFATAGNQTELFETLRSGKIALLLTYDLAIPPDFEFWPMAPMPPYAFVGAAHRFARRRSISLAELATDNFLLLDLPMSRDYFLSLFRQAGVNPNIAGRYPYIDVIRSLVGRGDGFSLANAQPKNLSTLDGRKLSYLALEDDLRPLHHGIAVLKDMRRTPTAEAFIKICRELLEGKPLPGTR
jgi:DNA-binding transcriptional LysR family regulator